MPINYKEYGSDWKRISKAVKHRAGDRCELCGAPNGEKIIRQKKCGAEWTLAEIGRWVCKKERIRYGEPIKVVLTVHHIDFNKMNNKKWNLIALCQRCHLRLDLGYKMEKRKQKKIGKVNDGDGVALLGKTMMVIERVRG